MRHAFTLLELMIVISILVVLISILLPTIVKVRRMAQIADTETRLEALRVAMSLYLERHALAGPPLDGLHMIDDYARMLIDGGHMDKVKKFAVILNADGTVTETTPDLCSHIQDAWNHAILMQVKNEPMRNSRTGEVLNANRFHTTEVYLRSEGGSGGFFPDDIVYRFAFSRRTWERVYMLEHATETYWYVDVVQ
jgi:prepilin-type N-terminal cleavage/methylation domain-containing protein